MQCCVAECQEQGKDLSKFVVAVEVLVSPCAVEVVLLAHREGENQPDQLLREQRVVN